MFVKILTIRGGRSHTPGLADGSIERLDAAADRKAAILAILPRPLTPGEAGVEALLDDLLHTNRKSWANGFFEGWQNCL